MVAVRGKIQIWVLGPLFVDGSRDVQVRHQVYLSVQNIEARLKVSLPTDLGAALTDGVVLCHLANHVRPRSVPSIHVPSPAVVSVVPEL